GIHTTADDSSHYEPAELKEQWHDRDPVLRLQRYLEKQGQWSAAIGEAMEADIAAQLDAAWKEAQAYPVSTVEESLTHVFAEMTPRLRQQLEMLKGESNHA
ncbi:MAG: pyruvate dehydrogenase (acetyl-transferring) E1 component subunit alpha, partial [Anaerolineae bacterium]|nr:pyruvate dehydrogenase (acetyl-transferring) E1 component subunit alpha [Anaerolineae bacterium]